MSARVPVLLLAVPMLAALACESATNLDVAYAPPDAGSTDASAGDVDGSAKNDAEPAFVEGCPCDPTLGLGCCVTGSGAFCTNDLGECSSAKGEWLRCARRDPTFESECCWSGSGAGAVTRFASACKDGPSACLTDADCAGTGQPCKTVTCSGFTFGQCAANAPACPSP